MKGPKMFVITAGLIALTLAFSGCQKMEVGTVKNIEDIHKEEGIPVRASMIAPQEFSTFLNYTSTLTGVEESTASAMVSDKVADILAEVGDYVEKDQLIVTFPKDNPSIQYEQSRIAYEMARKAYLRVKNIYESNGLSRQEYDNAESQYRVSLANWESIQKMVEVRAPIAGFLTKLNVQKTDNVDPGTPLFTISEYSRQKATIWVSDNEIFQIKKGQKAYAEWNGITIPGEVVKVDLSMDQQKNAFAVLVEFDNRFHSVLSGVMADIKIITYTNEDAIVLPRKDLVNDGDAWYAYLVNGQTCRKQPVEIGHQQGMNMEISTGLTSGDQVIVEGLSMVRDNVKIKLLASKSNETAN